MQGCRETRKGVPGWFRVRAELTAGWQGSFPGANETLGNLRQTDALSRAVFITDFSLGREGEFAVTGFDDGRIYRLVLDEVDPRGAVGEAEARER
jgi:hypothetical protein